MTDDTDITIIHLTYVNNYPHLLSGSYVPITVYTLSYLILTILGGKYYLHFTSKKTDLKCILIKCTLLQSNKISMSMGLNK